MTLAKFISEYHDGNKWRDTKELYDARTTCSWCRSTAADDERGNCGACGGPRAAVEGKDFWQYTHEYRQAECKQYIVNMAGWRSWG